MFIIVKRKVYLLILIFAAFVVGVGFNLFRRPTVTQVVALPVNNKVIVLDARPSDGEDGGAVAEDRNF